MALLRLLTAYILRPSSIQVTGQMIIDSKKKKKKKKEPPLEMVKQGLVRSGTVILDTLGPTSDLHTHEYPCYVIALSRLQSMDRLEPHDDLLAKGMLDELTRTSRLKVPSWQRVPQFTVGSLACTLRSEGHRATKLVLRSCGIAARGRSKDRKSCTFHMQADVAHAERCLHVLCLAELGVAWHARQLAGHRESTYAHLLMCALIS